MRRRDFIGFLVTALPFPARAQRSALPMPRVGILVEFAEDDPETRLRLDPFAEAFRKLGWEDGRNVHVERRFWAGDPKRMESLCTELVSLKPDVILVSGAPATGAVQKATRSIPVVFVQVADPVGSGLVPSLGRPGGNLTGFTHFEYGIVGKWLQALKDIAPRVRRILMIQNPANFAWPGYVRSAAEVAPSFGPQVISAGVRDASEIETTVRSFAREPDGAMVVLPDTTTSVHRETIVALAARHKLPAVYPFRLFVTAGGLMGYGIDVPEVFRGAAIYVDRILRGEKPSDLPIQAATKFQLVINLGTAEGLGLKIPPTLLARADEVIE